MKVDAWLAQLGSSLEQGDIEGTQQQIRNMRQQVRGDAKTQLAANLPKKTNS